MEVENLYHSPHLDQITLITQEYRIRLGFLVPVACCLRDDTDGVGHINISGFAQHKAKESRIGF